MNVEIRAEAALFPEKEYISGIFFAVQLFLVACKTIYTIQSVKAESGREDSKNWGQENKKET